MASKSDGFFQPAVLVGYLVSKYFDDFVSSFKELHFGGRLKSLNV